MYYQTYNNHGGNSFAQGWMIASLILAIVGGIFTVLFFLKKSNKEKYNKKLKLLYTFLNFDFLTLEYIVKFLYTTVTVFIILSSFSYISYSFAYFLMYLILGVLFARIIFELIMLAIKICNNTTEINQKLKK